MSENLSPQAEALWQQRFRLPLILEAQVAWDAPHRGLILTNRDAPDFLYHRWNVTTAELQLIDELADRPRQDTLLSADGDYIYYLQDEGGDELGHLWRIPYKGGQAIDLTPNMKPYTLRGQSQSLTGRRLALNAVNEDGFQLLILDFAEGGELLDRRCIFDDKIEFWEALLSPDGRYVAIISTRRSGSRRYSTIVFDTQSGQQVAELWDGPEHSVEQVAWAPAPGDYRLLVTSTRSGYKRPVVWQPLTGSRQNIAVPELVGEVDGVAWYPDGSRLLLANIQAAQLNFYCHTLAKGQTRPLDHPSGSFGFAAGAFGPVANFAPDGTIHAIWQDAAHPLQLIALDPDTGGVIETVFAVGPALPARPWKSVNFVSSDGATVQGWLAVPAGPGPFPTMIEMHGGPHMVMTETFHPAAQKWLDHGFAYCSINYRGSTTFGSDFREKIWGNLGHWELEDVVAGRQWLIDNGISRPEAIFLTGASYGGYLTLLALGKFPELWAGGLAVVAIGDEVLAFEDSSEALRVAMINWHGGTPTELPEEYRRSSPITYAANVRAPVHIIQGENDSRCPPRQMRAYEAKMLALGKDITVHWFDAGHGLSATEQIIDFEGLELAFAQKCLAALRQAPGAQYG